MDVVHPSSTPPLPGAHVEHVLERLRAQMARADVGAVVTFAGPNILYATGWASVVAYRNMANLTPAVVFSDPGAGRVLVESEFRLPGCPVDEGLDLRSYPTWTYVEDPRRTEPPELTAEASLDLVLDQVLAALAERSFGGRVGVDTEGLNVTTWAALSERLTAAGIEPVLVSDVFLGARRVKSAWEIDNLKAAHDITQRALLACREMIEVGVTATAVRREFIRQCWADPRTTEVRFANISVGPSWSPVYYPDRTEPARAGDLVAFDAGAEVRGYGADLARAWPVGSPGTRADEVHKALEAGHRELLGALVPGARLSEVFEHTMSVVRGHGLSEYRRGHVGHSVGLSKAIEEWPQISPTATQTADEGMVLCLETPYYGFGIGAMNVEDMVVVGKMEAENWTSMPSWGSDV